MRRQPSPRTLAHAEKKRLEHEQRMEQERQRPDFLEVRNKGASRTAKEAEMLRKAHGQTPAVIPAPGINPKAPSSLDENPKATNNCLPIYGKDSAKPSLSLIHI